MFTRSFELFKIFGFSIRIDLSWFIIAVLVAWSLAGGLFPRLFPELDAAAHWTMGIIGTLGLFASIVLHELGHALVARRFGVEMRSITLFIFGGVAEMKDEPPSPKAEFWVALAGPVASVGIALIVLAGDAAAVAAGMPAPVTGVLRWLWWINLIVVAFNLVPAFPLDGGRVLRSILWKTKGSLRRATRITSQIGSGFGVALMLLGVLGILGGNFVGGLWWILIGLFLREAARMGYQQLIMRRALEGEPIHRFMHKQVDTVEPQVPVDRFVEDYIYRFHHKMFPVVRGQELLGCVSADQVRRLPRGQWPSTTVQMLAEPCGPQNTVRPEADAMEAMARMNRHGVSKLLVVEDGRLSGILSLRDLLAFIALKVELEDEPGAASRELRRHAPV